MDFVIAGNAVDRWLYAVVFVLATNFIVGAVKRIAKRRLEPRALASSTPWDNAVLELLASTKAVLVFFIAAAVAVDFLSVPAWVQKVASRAVVLTLLVQIAVWGAVLISFFVEYYVKARYAGDGAREMTVRAIGILGKLIFFSVLVLWALDNMGVNITALVAGLGVGGVAVALAVQNILGDLFASLSIVLDKPFVPGDFIIAGNEMGTIERIGIKTTRVRSLWGEELIFPNQNLLQSRVRNFKRMRERRSQFGFGVTYDTEIALLRQIPGIVKEAIEKQPRTRFERAHFKAFGASSLDFEILYVLDNPDMNFFMDTQQAINLELMTRFQSLGIEFAFPVQELRFAGEWPTPPARS